jgi:hypothetical protein
MKTTKSSSKEAKGTASPSHLIDARIKELGDWRGETLARVRVLIRLADPDVVEEVKWRKPSNAMLGVPVWEHDGIICTGETYKAVEADLAKGASLEDPAASPTQSRRQHEARHRYPMRATGREGVEGVHPRRRAEHVAADQAPRPLSRSQRHRRDAGEIGPVHGLRRRGSSGQDPTQISALRWCWIWFRLTQPTSRYNQLAVRVGY